MRTNLKLLRVKNGLNQTEMAGKLGVSLVTYAFIEQGKRQGKHSFWNAVQKEFGISDSDMWELQKNEGCEQCE